MTLNRPVVAFTVDLEPDCPPFLTGYRGIERGLPALLDLLAEVGVPATFFTTGDVAVRYPRAVERVVEAGHELGCHGMTHTAFTSMDVCAARQEIENSSEILRKFAPVRSFRAPYLRFPDEYVGLLEDADFDLDSSQARYKLAYYRRGRATDADSPNTGFGDVIGVAAAASRATRISRRALESDRAVRSPVGVRRSASREATARLPVQDGGRRAGVCA